jgi:hypothetical protein
MLLLTAWFHEKFLHFFSWPLKTVLLFMGQKYGPWEKNEGRVLNAFETWCWRRMLKIKWTDRITNDEVFFFF